MDWLPRARVAARLAYLGILLLATLTPYQVDLSGEGLAARMARVLHPDVGNRDVIDGARNVVLFAGWGAVWALTAAASLRRIVRDATVSGLVISATVELAQLFTRNRVSSLIDVATNTGGAFAGALGLLLLAALANQRRNAKSFVGIPAICLAASYGVAVWLEAVVPLFRHDDMFVGGPVARMEAALAAIRFGAFLDLPWGDVLLFAPAGALAVAALSEAGLGYSLARRRVAASGAGLGLVAELMHGPLGQPIVIGAALLHALAVGLGAWGSARWLPTLSVALRGVHRVRALSVSYVLVLACWAWRPYLPEYQLDSMRRKLTTDWYLPLAGLAMAQDFFSVVDVCAPFFLYLPLGALLAVWPWRRRGWLAGPLAGVWVATALEGAQILVLGRMLDITDVMITSSGVLVGWAIFRRAGYQVYGEVFPRG